MSRWQRSMRVAAAVAVALIVAGCGGDEPAPEETGPDDPGETEAPTLDDDAEDGADGADDAADGADDGADGADDAADGADDGADDGEDGADAGADDADDVTERETDETARLDVDATTDVATRDTEGSRLIVTDVRVGAHDGFDRVVIELAGEGEVGWFIEPTDDPRSQGSGLPIEVAGDAALLVAVRTIVLPGDEPAQLDPAARFEADAVAGTGDGPVVEVVRDTLFEGIETYAIGLDEARPYRVDRFVDPERVVIDIEAS